MEPELDIFDQWAEDRQKKLWIVRKLDYISAWWSVVNWEFAEERYKEIVGK